jgi:DNA-binding transcriptional ArsR family regulator
VLILDDISAVTATAQVRRSAGVECCLAMWAGSAPEREPLKPLAQSIQSRMHPRAQDALAALDGAFPDWPLFAVNAFYRIGVDDLGESLDLLRRQPPRGIAVALLGVAAPPFGASHGVHDPLVAALQDGRVPVAARRHAQALIARPEETVSWILRVVEAFAHAGFREIFEQQRERFAAVAAHLDRELAGDAPKVISELSPRAFLHAAEDRVTLLGGRVDQVVSCAELERLDVLPSFWLRRRVILARAPGRVGLCISTGGALRAEIDQERTTSMLSALGEPRRFEIFRLCLERSRTTQELSAALRITEGPVSRHLKALELGGLVVRQRTGRLVMYTAVVEALQLLGRELLALPQQTRSRHQG